MYSVESGQKPQADLDAVCKLLVKEKKSLKLVTVDCSNHARAIHVRARERLFAFGDKGARCDEKKL
jgi:hypothetical protein